LQAWQFLIARASNRRIIRYEALRHVMAYDDDRPLFSILVARHGALQRGVVFGLTADQIYSLLGKTFALLPNLRPVRPLSNGRFELQVDALNGRNYAIESSADLVAWN